VQEELHPVELSKQIRILRRARRPARRRLGGPVGRPKARATFADLVEMTGRDLGADRFAAEEISSPRGHRAYA
jgi:hypothetical protein